MFVLEFDAQTLFNEILLYIKKKHLHMGTRKLRLKFILQKCAMNNFTSWTLPAIDNKEAFQADSFALTLVAIDWR
jgi:hypothetical protein